MPLSRRQKLKFLGLLVGVVAGIVFCLFSLLDLFEAYELKSLDFRLRLRGERKLSDSLSLVAVDNKTLRRLGWPVRRALYANLIEMARKHGARVVGFDILFTDPSGAGEEDDALFAAAAEAAGNVVFPLELVFSGKERDLRAVGANQPLEALRRASRGTAHVHLDNRDDGVFRKAPLFFEYQGEKIPALGLRLAAMYLNADLADGNFPAGLPATALAENSSYINFRSAGRGANIHSLVDLLAARGKELQGQEAGIDLERFFRDKLVLVGQTAASVGDHGPVPLSHDAPLVLAHANFIDNLLRRDFLRRTPPWVNSVMILLLCVLVGMAAVFLRTLPGAFLGLSILAAYVAINCFILGWASIWLELVSPLAGGFFTCLGTMIYNRRVRDALGRRLRGAFEKYLPPNILEQILENPQALEISGRRRLLSVLFTDIKGYTTLSQDLPPAAILDLLRQYIEAMTRVIFKLGGTIDKIMGDGIMAFFGDPIPYEDHAERAVQAALEMQEEMNKLQRRWVAEGKTGLQVRIGVATGEAYVGNIGTSQHIEYTAIGRTVNLAARLESVAPPGGILISRETFQRVKDRFDCEEIAHLKLKGYREAREAYWVFGPKAKPGTPPASETVERRQTPRTELVTAVKYSFGGKTFYGRAVNASQDGMFIATEHLPEVGTEISVTGSVHAGEELLPVEIYGVVRRLVTEGEGRGMGVQFDRIIADQADTIRYFLSNVFGIQKFHDQEIIKSGDTAHPVFWYDLKKV